MIDIDKMGRNYQWLLDIIARKYYAAQNDGVEEGWDIVRRSTEQRYVKIKNDAYFGAKSIADELIRTGWIK